MKKIFVSLLALFIFQPAFAVSRPKLVVMIVIDQFRADYLQRLEDKFSSKGFKYLISNGAYFPYGEYDILQSMTGPGHATILTGAYPYQMGIPINDWFNQKTKIHEYCVQDKNSPIVGAEGKEGRSPKNLVGTTVGDELKNAAYENQTITLALKDRAAILMGGHRADLAFWNDGKQWVSSKHYLKDEKLPTWISNLNAELKKKPCMLASPCGIEISVQAFKAVLDNFKLGKSKGTDIVALSFSAHDYVGHAHSLTSSEMNEMVMAEDKGIAQIIEAINAKIPGGMKNTVVVLTGDHGTPPKFSDLQKAGIEAERMDADAIQKDMEIKLQHKFGKPKSGNWIDLVTDFNFFLNRAATENEEGKALFEKMQEYLKAELEKNPGFAHVFTLSDYKNRRLPPQMFKRQIEKTYYEGRSGHVIALVKPFYSDAGKNAITHMTGYTYDRMVPIIFTGSGIKKGLYADKAEVVDIAPTLSFLLGVVPPALSEGRVLKEILR